MKRLLEKRIVPAATLDRTEDALPLAEALLAAGLDIIEITFRTPAAAEAIRLIVQRFPDMLVGAGTVLTEDQLQKAAAAGIRFAVAPGFNERLVARAAERRIPFIPGVATATEIDRAVGAGCKLLKFFPAASLGGPETLKAVSAPFSHLGIKYLPTGGINTANAAEYLSLGAVAAVGGSWMVAGPLIKAGNWAEITRLSREALAMAKQASRS